MTHATSPRLPGYAALAATALMAALVTGRAELAVLATPFALLVAVALSGSPLALDGELRLLRDRALEGESLRATFAVTNLGAPVRADVLLEPGAPPFGVWLERGERRELEFEVSPRSWGVHDIGPAVVRARDQLGGMTLDGPLGEAAQLHVFASAERLRRIVAPSRTRPVLGSLLSRERGEGIEFADLRPLEPGDRVRGINWRATARRGTPYVNLQHPEHSADVVLFLDTFAEAEGTLDAAVRSAASLASSYLARRDRVALVSLGGELSWLTGSPETRQLYRILDALFSSQVRPSFRWRGVTQVPRRLLAARALVIALSPLLDDRGIAALLDLRARGYDLVVLEVPPATAGDTPALRLWRLQRDALRRRFEVLGIPLARTVEEVIALRRRVRVRS
jgi:uncharacterized protein (DUF58 family)